MHACACADWLQDYAQAKQQEAADVTRWAKGGHCPSAGQASYIYYTTKSPAVNTQDVPATTVDLKLLSASLPNMYNTIIRVVFYLQILTFNYLFIGY